MWVVMEVGGFSTRRLKHECAFKSKSGPERFGLGN